MWVQAKSPIRVEGPAATANSRVLQQLFVTDQDFNQASHFFCPGLSYENSEGDHCVVWACHVVSAVGHSGRC